MATLSISLPDSLVRASQEAARKMGISRTEFIRQAVAHELTHFQEKLEEKAMVESIMAMKESKIYLQESNNISKEFDDDLPKDENKWWRKNKKS